MGSTNEDEDGSIQAGLLDSDEEKYRYKNQVEWDEESEESFILDYKGVGYKGSERNAQRRFQ